jgi:preprotein translocase subunit SecA
VKAYLNLDLPIEEWAAEEGIAEDDIHGAPVEADDKLASERCRTVRPGSHDARWRNRLLLADA